MGDPVDAVLVVVPARDEQELLPGCLAALSVATRSAATTGVAVRTVVVANGCVDATAAVAAGAGVDVMVSTAANVGQARADGCSWGRVVFPHVGPHRLWFATTDADSRVPERWLLAQLAAARRGADACAGTVELAPSDAVRHRRWTAEYRRKIDDDGRHSHAHGANLGVRADAYKRVGGFAAVECGEDERLLACLAADGARIERRAADPVTTSARRRARAPRGLSADLARVASVSQLRPVGGGSLPGDSYEAAVDG